MTEIKLMCETIVRLSNMLATEADQAEPIFSTIRIDGGQAVATNRRYMAIQNIGGNHDVLHLIIEPALLQQCRTEMQYNGSVNIVRNDMLRYCVAKTSLGYVHPNNVAYYPDGPTDFDRWRSIVADASKPAKKSNGGMFWDVEQICKLASTSPSGRVVFEQHIDVHSPTLVRDVKDYDWLGVFNPFSKNDHYEAATLPSWMKVAGA